MKLLKFLVAALATSITMAVQSQTVTTVTVASGPGGNLERFGRIFQKNLPEWLGYSVVFEYKPGGGGQIGAQHLARSTANGPHFMVSMMSYDPSIDQTTTIIPILTLGELGEVAYTRIDGVKNFAEIADPQNRVFSSAMQNVPNSMLDGFMDKMSGRINRVLYTSAAKQITDVLGRHIDMGITTPPNIRAHVEAGTLRPLWVFNSKRLPNLPDVPTIRELGLRFPQEDMKTYVMLWASTKTSATDIAKLQKEFKSWLSSQDGINTLRSMDIQTVPDAVVTNPDIIIKRLVLPK